MSTERFIGAVLLAVSHGHGLASGQAIDLSPELGPGSHTFVVTAADNVGNTSSTQVQFTVGS